MNFDLDPKWPGLVDILDEAGSFFVQSFES